MDEDGVPDVLKTERMGHEMPGMHGVYGHVSPAMRATLKAALQARWEDSLRERAKISSRSIVRSSTPCWSSTGSLIHDPLPSCSQDRTVGQKVRGPRPCRGPLTRRFTRAPRSVVG